MKKLINKVEDVVQEQVEGLLMANPELVGSDEPRFVYLMGAHSLDQVALVSGGGSGHEPMHAGFVGKGMLTGACPGEVFTSPTPDQMYECAKAVDSGKGVLFLVKNYTGDVLNFETAVELLHAEGVKVGTVLVDDDVAVKDSLYTAGRRGVAGTVLIEKILGAAAAEGYSMEQLEELGRRLNNRTRSFGIALSTCVVPAVGEPSFILQENEMEFGVGIHGEPGIERRTYKDCDTLVQDMFGCIIDDEHYSRVIREWDRETGDWNDVEHTTEPLGAGDKVIVLLNGMGATPESELLGAYRKFHSCCEESGLRIIHRLVGNYCTSLNMEGLSLTIMKADDEILRLWEAPVETMALRWG
ncbi:dihydroxyacetone kinase subunit DhaK [Sansalvadorimonas sp. 2012CJ34-2]|uniref:Dihydroxyacetone kinase subunit DhaK n=1 Tax=Parendozoicomonas callyspongiae TaxID=2942213 RepID=A0ABT0PJ15_9GAMM|nr:dihydroxyacetone kinase subunit DhaK [Sansalvadorimonas sp. 2012CJ34-2]MCL6271251.1 dihydroxyacetone kinase subunit DhaK [Sansalvadorimonas sp. 2012CJ34-2]